MTLLTKQAFADVRRLPQDFFLQNDYQHRHPLARPLAGAFPVHETALSALRLPAEVECVRFSRSTISTPVISVVVPVRNRCHTLNRTIASALQIEDQLPFELIVVDDGSDDGTTRLVEALSDPRISALGLTECRGANTARNVGVAIARAPIIAFLDSDDDYLPGRLSDPLRLLAENPTVGAVISSFTARKGKIERMLQLQEKVYEPDAFFRLIADYILPPSTSGLTIRREALIACGGFNPKVRRMQDRDLLLRLAQVTSVATSPVVAWRKNWGEDGISSPRSTYYEALCEFVALHPIYAAEKVGTRNYLIARHLIALTKRGMWRRAMEVYRHARSSLSPSIPALPLLILQYLAAKRRRRKAASKVLLKGAAPSSVKHT